MRPSTAFLAIGIALGLGACATVHNLPLNEPSATPYAGSLVQLAAAETRAEDRHETNSGAVIGLAFSGGGTRAAAFAYGVLQQLAHTPLPRSGGERDLVDHVAIVSGVSGGSIIAAYYGLKGRAALADFRQNFLDQDVMAVLQTDASLVNISKALGGGVNTDNRLRDWFNAHLFHDATFGALIGRRPIVLINATDVYDRTPFLFAPVTFAAMCSDLTQYPIAAAVAASSAVPGAFAPIIIEPYPGRCQTPLPPAVQKAANSPGGSPLLHSFAMALERARTGKVKYIKLFDGGLVDNYGLSGLTIARAASGTPYGPLRPQEAVNLRRLLFLVVDAGQGPQGDWAQTLQGPSGKQLIGAVIDALMAANTRSSYAAFEATMNNWRDELVRWRCGLKSAEVARLRGGRLGRWSCRDLKFTVARVSFDELGPARAKLLGAVPTSLTLPAATVDEVTKAGEDALRANPGYQTFVRDLGGAAASRTALLAAH
jgi:NTE family protein